MSPADFSFEGFDEADRDRLVNEVDLDRLVNEVDLDRLADYGAGVLDVADAAEVANLVATDPRWAQAHAALVSADELIRGELRAEAIARIEPMPADVVARVEETLAALQPRGRDAATPATVISISDRRRPKRRGQRIVAGIAGGIAAAFALVVAINLNPGMRAQDATTMGAAESADSPRVVESQPPALAPALITITASGSDYALETLGTFARHLTYDAGPSPSFMATQSPGSAPAKSAVPPAVPSAVGESAAKTSLSRLAEPAALADCLTAILAARPGNVAAVDFARYEGQPSLVVLVHGQTGAVVLAVGPDCGLNGPDIKGTSVR